MSTQGQIEALAEARLNLAGLDPNDDALWEQALVEARAELEEGDGDQ